MRISNNTRIHFTITMQLNEEEARALDAMIGYGFNTFLATFYEHLGKGYLEPHEAGLRRVFDAVREQVSPELFRIDRAVKILANKTANKGGERGEQR